MKHLAALMKSFLMVAFLLRYALSIAQSPEDLKNKEAIARNKVKTQVSWDYKYSGEKPVKTGVKTSITTFTAKGDLSQVDALNPKGTVTHSEKYSYDARGNKTEYTRNSGESSYQKKYMYNDKNQLTEESGFDGVENFRNLYSYNVQGEMTEIRYMKKSVLFEKRVFEKKDATTTVSVYNVAGVVTSKLMLKYDTRGNLVEEVVYGGNQSELEKKTYHYDDNKNLKEEAKYKLDKITLKTSYNYNSTGALVEIIEEAPGIARFVKKSFTYDPQGNLLEIKWRRKGTEEFNRIAYQYDDRGLCTSADTYYPATHYRVLTKYSYE
jgi:YD repeat-containing protein